MIMQAHKDRKKSPVEEIKAWLENFAKCVQSKDFEKGKTLFSPSCWCFGSYAEVLNNLDDLVENQWKQIWPNITDFHFDLNKLHCQFSQDQRMACIMAPWYSTGYRPDGMIYARPGRVTIVLLKDPVHNSWLAHHTHYSLNPGTPLVTKRQENNDQLSFDDIFSVNKA